MLSGHIEHFEICLANTIYHNIQFSDRSRPGLLVRRPRRRLIENIQSTFTPNKRSPLIEDICFRNGLGQASSLRPPLPGTWRVQRAVRELGIGRERRSKSPCHQCQTEKADSVDRGHFKLKTLIDTVNLISTSSTERLGCCPCRLASFRFEVLTQSFECKRLMNLILKLNRTPNFRVAQKFRVN